MTQPPCRDADRRPAPPPDPDTLPTSLTFFLSMDERSRVLARLRRHGRGRGRALLAALRLDPTPRAREPRDG